MLDKLKQPIGFSKVFLNALILVCALGLSSNALADYSIGPCTVKDPVNPPQGTSCSGQNLSSLDFSNVGAGIDLRFADFKAADISNTNFTKSDLAFADFTGATFGGGAPNFSGVKWKKTLCPDGFLSEAHIGQTCVGAYLDTDLDGVTDAADAFPGNAAASEDSDADGFPDSWNKTCDAACEGGSGLIIDKFPDNNAASKDDDNDGFPEAWNTVPFNCNITCQVNSGLAIDAGLDDAGAIFVDVNTPTPYGSGADGLSWATAWPTLNDALAVVTAGQEIWIAEGVYYPDEVAATNSDSPDDSFVLVNKTSLVGGFAGGESFASEVNPSANPVVLSGDIAQDDTNVDLNGVHTAFEAGNNHNGTNSHHVVDSSSVIARLSGLIISGGGSGQAGNEAGGGIYCVSTTLSLHRVKLFYNRSISTGGAISCHNASTKLTLDEVLIDNNYVGTEGGGINMNNASQLKVFRSSITNNKANSGGGVNLSNGSTAIIENSTIAFNTANASAGIRVHGDGTIDSTNLEMYFSTIAFNNATVAASGGLALINFVRAELIATVIAGNTAATAGSESVSRTTNDEIMVDYSSFGESSISGLYLGSGDLGLASFLTNPSPTSSIPAQALGELLGSSLINLGGFTPLIALPINSSLKNAINEFECDSTQITFDQRGLPRPYKQQYEENLNCDIGAYESNDHDQDGVEDAMDVFPENSAASDDEDEDGFPDAWTLGCDSTCQINSGLVLDAGLDDAGAIFVNKSTPTPYGSGADGLAWATAWPNVADALAVATAGQEIWIAKGIYYPDEYSGGNFDAAGASFTLVDQVNLVGGFSGSGTETKAIEADPKQYDVVLNGDITQDDTFVSNGIHTAFQAGNNHNSTNSLSIVTANSVTARIQNLIISGGGSPSTTSGGGLICNSSTLSLKNIKFFFNRANSSGGAIFCNNDGGGEFIKVHNAHVEGNYAGSVGGGFVVNGGGMHIENSVFVSNRAAQRAGAISQIDTKTRIINSTFTLNTAADAGAIFVDGNAILTAPYDLDILYSTIAFNNADGNTATGFGGGIYVTNYADIHLYGTVVTGNSAGNATPGSENLYRTPVSQVTAISTRFGSAGNGGLFLQGTGSVALNMMLLFGAEPSTEILTQGLAAIIASGLVDHGGDTLVLPFPSASPLRNAIPEFNCRGYDVNEDQRGEQRPYEYDSANMNCDIGAYELNDHDLDSNPDNFDNDDDNDGMDDIWENGYFLDPYFAGDATADPDGDTLTNLQEYNLGRNPTFADYAEPETDLVISPKSYRYIFEFDTATCDTVSTPVTYTIKNNDTVSRNITGAITFDNVVNSTDWKIKSGTDTCSSSPISPGASCTFDVVFCAPNANGNHAGEIKVPTDSVDTPILTSALYNYEADPVEAERRLPPVISNLVIKDSGGATITDGQIKSGDTHSYEWTITGYHPTYESSIAFFDCDGVSFPNCGSNFGTNIFDSSLMTPLSTAAGTWTYNGIVANTYTYSVSHTLTYDIAKTNEYVLRFYRKSGQDVQAGKSSLSGLIPGNIMPLSADYYDTAGRRIIINVIP